tara:strand:+ start:397 stop:567 length:171 start_codon:yes stop_codon:yes gene_type:complete
MSECIVCGDESKFTINRGTESESVLYLAESNRLNVFCNSVKVLKRIRRNEERRAKQ